MLEVVQSDLPGPVEPEAKDVFKYTLAFTDDYSGVAFVYFLKAKSDTIKVTERFIADGPLCKHNIHLMSL